MSWETGTQAGQDQLDQNGVGFVWRNPCIMFDHIGGKADRPTHVIGDFSQRQARIQQAGTRRWIGTPYHDQASVRGVGCDCLGLLRGAWREFVGPEPMPVPPYSRDWGESGPVEVLAEAARAAMIELDASDARTGDIILFRMRPGAIGKHCGILSGNNRFIHAYERTGVIEEPLTAAWQRRVAYAFRFPDAAKRKA